MPKKIYKVKKNMKQQQQQQKIKFTRGEIVVCVKCVLVRK